MSTNIRVTKTLSGDTWVVLAEVIPGGTLPEAIFIYENLGTTELGSFQGVCSVEELIRLQKWEGVQIPKFGNKFVRHTQAKIFVSKESDPESVISRLALSLKFLDRDLRRSSETTRIITI